jgi:hypothetical protein
LARNVPENGERSHASGTSTLTSDSHAKENRYAYKQIELILYKRFLVESQLITNDQLNQDAAQRILRSAQFGDFVRKMIGREIRSRLPKSGAVNAAIRRTMRSRPRGRMPGHGCSVRL